MFAHRVGHLCRGKLRVRQDGMLHQLNVAQISVGRDVRVDRSGHLAVLDQVPKRGVPAGRELLPRWVGRDDRQHRVVEHSRRFNFSSQNVNQQLLKRDLFLDPLLDPIHFLHGQVREDVQDDLLFRTEVIVNRDRRDRGGTGKLVDRKARLFFCHERPSGLEYGSALLFGPFRESVHQ